MENHVRMAEPKKSGAAAGPSAAVNSGRGLSTLDDRLPSPRLNLTLSMPATSRPGEEPSSSSGENFFRGFRLQFPGFSRREPDCSDGEARGIPDEDGEPDRGDGGLQEEPDSPSPVLQINKKRLYHVPVRPRNPTNASKKLRLEGSNGARPASLVLEAGSSQEAAPDAAAGPSWEPGKKPVASKPALLRSSSEDAGGSHLLDETLATFHKIVADTSKIMEKLCTERKPPSKSERPEPGDVCEKPEVLGSSAKPSTDDGPKTIQEKAGPELAEGRPETRERNAAEKILPRNANSDVEGLVAQSKPGKDEGGMANEGPEPKDRQKPPRNGTEEEPPREPERFRSGGDGNSAPAKSAARPPSFHWPSPSGGVPKVAIVSPLLSSEQKHGAGKPDKAHAGAGPSQGRGTKTRGSRRDGAFPPGFATSSSSSEEEDYAALPPQPPRTRAKARLPPTDSSSEEETLDAMRRSSARNGPKPERGSRKRGGGGKPPPQYRFSSSSSDEEVGEDKRYPRMALSSLRELAATPRWRTPKPGQQAPATAYLLEEVRGSRGARPASSGGSRRRLWMPVDWEVIGSGNSSSDEDSDLEVISHVKPARRGCSCGSSSKDKDKRKYQAFPAAVVHRPGTSRMFEERPSCSHQRQRPDAGWHCPEEDPAPRGRQEPSGSRMPKSKSSPGKSRALLRRMDFDLFDPELSSDEGGGGGKPPPPRRSARRGARIVSSSSETEVDEDVVASASQRPWGRRPARAACGDLGGGEQRAARARSASPLFKSGPLLDTDGPWTTLSRGPLSPSLARLDSPGELDAVHQIEQIETDEAYARRLQAEFDAEANTAAPPAGGAAPPERTTFTPVRAGPSAPHRYSRSRNPSPRVVSAASGFRSSRPRTTNARPPSQQSLLNASRHRSSGGRMRGAAGYDGMAAAAMLPMMDTGHFNRMLLGFQDEWMSLIASVAVPTVESDPEETSRGRSPRNLRRRPAARANASSDDTDIDGITFESLLTYSDDEDDYWQAGVRPAANQTGRTGARRRSRGRRAHGNYWTPNQGNDYEELLELAERLGHVSRGLNRTQINRLPTHQFSKASADGGGGNGGGGATSRTTECHICMSEYENGERLRILPCFHDFHTNCIDRWLREKNTCPVCRLRVQVS